MAKVSNAQALALFAESNGWKVKREVSGEVKTIIATRPDEEVTASWNNNAAFGPNIGHHSHPNGVDPIKNAASAKRILILEPGNTPQPKEKVKRKTPVKVDKLARVKLTFDPYKATDTELLDAVRGRKVTWVNHWANEPESANVPVNGKHTKIENSKSEETLGERILSFCDPVVGYRALFVGAIIKVK